MITGLLEALMDLVVLDKAMEKIKKMRAKRAVKLLRKKESWFERSCCDPRFIPAILSDSTIAGLILDKRYRTDLIHDMALRETFIRLVQEKYE
jgi:hypothetical protein